MGLAERSDGAMDDRLSSDCEVKVGLGAFCKAAAKPMAEGPS